MFCDLLIENRLCSGQLQNILLEITVFFELFRSFHALPDILDIKS